MPSIGKIDHLVLQLRAQLQRAASQRTRHGSAAARVEKGPLDRLRAADGLGPYQEQEFRRKFIRAVLTEELGEDLANQPEFERISDEVWKLIEEDEDLGQQLSEALRQLK